MRLSRLFSTLALLLVFASPLFAQPTRFVDERTGIPYLANLPPLPGTTLTVNGQPVTGKLNIVGENATFDPATNTLLLASTGGFNRGASAQGNTTISGSLTVTGACFFGSGGGTPIHAYGPILASHYIQHSYDAGSGSTTVTVVEDVTDILDAGANVTLTMPTVINGRVLFLYNESATWTASDGGSITVTPNSSLTLHGVGGQWK